MVFAFFASILGCVIGIRTLDRLIADHLFEKKEMTKIGTAYFCAVILTALILPHSYLSLWISVFVPLAVITITLFALVKKRSARFRIAVGEALALVSLKMKAGRSFRQAYSEVAAESRPLLRAKLTEIGSVVVFSQQRIESMGDAFINEVIEELTIVDRQPHSATRRLAIFREKLRIEDDFRRRSGQVLARLRAQSLIMTVLFVAMLAFMAWRFGFKQNMRVFLCSTLLFSAGSAWMLRGGRNLRWKV
jgi:hypothetical protein